MSVHGNWIDTIHIISICVQVYLYSSRRISRMLSTFVAMQESGDFVLFIQI